MSEFTDKVVLVTGGTRGIGRACSQAFAQADAKVALCGRSADSAREVAETIAEATSGEVQGFQSNIADPESVKALIKQVSDTLGPIAILVNNAGITRDGLLMRMKDADWDAVLETNLNGAFYCCRAAARGMMKQRYGRIINISSVVGIRGQAGQTNYAAAKAGLIGFTKSLAQELASRNITANVVAPGYITTDMTSDLPDDLKEKIIQQIPAARQGTPEEIAHAVLFLATDAAAYITGHTLSVDGGLGM